LNILPCWSLILEKCFSFHICSFVNAVVEQVKILMLCMNSNWCITVLYDFTNSSKFVVKILNPNKKSMLEVYWKQKKIEEYSNFEFLFRLRIYTPHKITKLWFLLGVLRIFQIHVRILGTFNFRKANQETNFWNNKKIARSLNLCFLINFCLIYFCANSHFSLWLYTSLSHRSLIQD